MGLTFMCLMVHPSDDAVKALTERLWPEIQFTTVDRVDSIADAFQKLAESNYNICFIHNQVQENLDSFFRDMQKLGRHKTCIFIQLWDRLPQGYDKSTAIELGFSDVISRDIAPEERDVLREVLKIEQHRQETSRRVQDVSLAITFLLKEVDRVAHERSRGKDVSFDRLIRNFVKMQSEFDEEVLNEYYEGLTEKTSTSQAFETKKIKVPEKVLKRKLPCLTEDSYTGMSLRVWLKMLKKFGVTDPEEIKEHLAKLGSLHKEE